MPLKIPQKLRQEFSFPQIKKDLKKSCVESKTLFLTELVLFGTIAFIAFAFGMFKIVRSLFKGDFLSGMYTLVFLFLFCVSLAILFRGIVLEDSNKKEEKRSSLNILLGFFGMSLAFFLGILLKLPR